MTSETAPSSSIESFDVICGRIESLESFVGVSVGSLPKSSVNLGPRIQELESKMTTVIQKVSNYNQIQESFAKLGLKDPLRDLTSNLPTDIDKKLSMILSTRSQLELAIKQLQQIESHRRSLEAVSATSSEFLNDVDVNKRLDEVESTLLKLSYEINDCHTVELDKLLSSYEALMIDFSDTLIELNTRLHVLEQSS